MTRATPWSIESTLIHHRNYRCSGICLKTASSGQDRNFKTFNLICIWTTPNLVSKRSGGTMNRLSVIALITIVSISYGQPMAFCAEPSSAKGSQGSSTKSAADESTDATAELGLENIQDVAYTLQRIRQQAINIYVEATRKKVHHYELNIPSLSSMPQDALESQSAYLPLRKAWLV